MNSCLGKILNHTKFDIASRDSNLPRDTSAFFGWVFFGDASRYLTQHNSGKWGLEFEGILKLH